MKILKIKKNKKNIWSFFLIMKTREQLIEMGLIIEGDSDTNVPADQIDDNDLDNFVDEPEADYDLQNEIIKFFNNNSATDPEVFRQYAVSIGVDPDEFQKQANILLSQLLKIYTQDASDLGYGRALEDDDVDEEIRRLVTPD